MRIENVVVSGWKNAVIGMRYPKNSEHLYDSKGTGLKFKLGKKDASLLFRLTKAGRDHRKVLRMIHVQASVDMPISWWIQYDTYKVATVANSRSRMHKMGVRELVKEDFHVDNWDESFDYVLDVLNKNIRIYQDNLKKDPKKAKEAWKKVIDLLPMAYQQERMIDLNYETLIAICEARYTEKLSGEWLFFIDNFLKTCPYLEYLWEVSTKKIGFIDVKNIINTNISELRFKK